MRTFTGIQHNRIKKPVDTDSDAVYNTDNLIHQETVEAGVKAFMPPQRVRVLRIGRETDRHNGPRRAR